MRRFLLRLAGTVAVSTAALVGWAAATLPPAVMESGGSAPAPTLVRGAYHVHSVRSDGSGTADEIARAAAQAGLRFVIITDHGDATRPPDPPAYRSGVLCIDAAEIRCDSGHVVALNLRSAAPYPLGGTARDVLEDIHRLGGWAVAAHPDSPEPRLRWRGTAASLDGIEWLNADSAWRYQSYGTVVITALRALFRPPEAVASLFGPSRAGLDAWDAAMRRRPTFTLAAVDAHARIGGETDGSSPPGRLTFGFPGYETMFRTAVQSVALDRPWTGDATVDADALLGAIAAGRSYSEIRAFVDAPGAFAFWAAAEDAGRVEWAGAVEGRVRLHASVPPDLGARLVLIRDGREVDASSETLDVVATGPGAYRVEVRLPGRQVPWIVSNAIRVGRIGARSDDVAMPRAGSPASSRPALPVPGESWGIEADPTSGGSLTRDGPSVRLNYRLGPGEPAGQYVALATGASGATPIERIEFTASSERPMRLSVQVRVPGGSDGLRWRRSIYVDSTPRQFSLALADLEPVEPRSSLRPVSARVQSVLLVIDTVNALPGSSGELTVSEARLVPGRAAPVDGEDGP